MSDMTNKQYTLEEVMEFLFGTGEIEGCAFGEKPESERGNFWWRKHLRAAWNTRTAHQADVVEEAIRLLEESAEPFDKACMILRNTRPTTSDEVKRLEEVMVVRAACVIAKSTLIDAPKLPPKCWEGLAREILNAALSPK